MKAACANRVLRMAIGLSAVIVLGAASACSATKGAPVHGVTLASARNARYVIASPDLGAIQLQDGHYAGQSRQQVTLVEPVAFGDLDGDGVGDAAVVLATETGGSGTFMSLHALVATAQGPRQLAVLEMGDRVRVQRTSVDNGVISLDVLSAGPADPLCCPTLRTTRQYRLKDGALTVSNGG